MNYNNSDERPVLDLDPETLRDLIDRLQKLAHELGNGTLTTVKKKNEECKKMVEQARELDDVLRKSE